MKSTRFTLWTGAAGVLAALVALILLNALAGQVRLRADLTKENLYTLSPATEQLMGKLDRDVTLKFYFSRSGDNLPMPLKLYARRILDLLREYETASGGRVVVEALDPEPDSEAEEWAQRYGLSPTPVDPSGALPPVYLGVVAISGARQAVIPFFAPSDEPQLEYLVTRLVNEVTAAQKPKIGVVSPLPLLGPGAMTMMGRGGEPWIVMQELRSQFDLVELPGSLEDIPADVTMLLLAHPRGIPDTALYAIDQFVLRGGTLLAFVDPQSLVDIESQPRQFSDPFSARSDMNRLTSAWGLTMDVDRVVADPLAATRVSMPGGGVESHRAWLSLRKENFNAAEIPLAGLDAMQWPMAGWFSGTPAEGLTMTPLVTASAEAGSLSSTEALMGAAAGMTSFRKADGPMHLAVRLTGTFTTAFPDGRPNTNPDQPNETPGATNRAPHLAKSEREGLVVLVADVDVLSDAFAARRFPMLGRNAYQLMNDNIHFTANLVGQLAGGDSLIGLRSRGTFERPFTRVVALQAAAQEKWRQEELKLQERLRLAQMRLDELQAGKSGDQQFIITPEQRKEIEDFRAQTLETRRELKEVRKNLRRDIEALGTKVKVINIAAVPAAVVSFGLLHGWRRRRRARG